ncbi:hypothetical protein BcepSauron_003 [Burkholderia phage BcepSauron]|uniref:Uncharacterized protein n=2 Tax=Sarumanvirus TaxID=2843450 RepID=A0A482MML7_9CAUD|nr:hypothetical protein H1O16_gp003 [Burkholderia phage BcepSaruman]YP_009904381.1 hypothetical protein H1O17_gp003 [Burkholderia phage BcepSauron]QBQ74383.1 hypothetical protein BcepSauron_003 [Burkholderia phage BcepSauron]QBX06416.1 hypothetical protein BcepSaruman_003 [Burkholderia phage BcepSaruman]
MAKTNQTGWRVALETRFGRGNVRVSGEWVEVKGESRGGNIVWHKAGRVDAL